MMNPATWQEDFFEHLRESGNISAAARWAGISRKVVYWHRIHNVAFARRCGEALAAAVSKLEAERRRRAAEHARPAHVSEYSDNMLMLLLRRHRPQLAEAAQAG